VIQGARIDCSESESTFWCGDVGGGVEMLVGWLHMCPATSMLVCFNDHLDLTNLKGTGDRGVLRLAGSTLLPSAVLKVQ
jgi:hypothetical protein